MSQSLVLTATLINAARLEANRNEATAPQTGVYGKLAAALLDTLTLISNPADAADIYQSILDGNTVEYAIKYVANQPSPVDEDDIFDDHGDTKHAAELTRGDRIFDYMECGERLTADDATAITETWRHGPLVTVLTARGYVEYDATELVLTGSRGA